MILCMACGGAKPEQGARGKALDIEYAQLLKIEQCDGYKLVTVVNPWKDNAVLRMYALVDRDAAMPEDIPEEATVVGVPLQRMCVSTSVHANLFMQLGTEKAIGSVCDANYILSEDILGLIKSGSIADAGSSMNPNVEKIVQLNTDAVLMSPFEGASYGLLEKTNIPIIECADYMETSALGRAEWIRFYGMLVGKEREAEDLFREVQENYLRLKEIAENASSKPKLLADMLNGQTWYMPGGKSIYGALFDDAGTNYCIGDKNMSGTQSLSLEKVMKDALDADSWLLKYGQAEDYTYESLAKENEAYTKFDAFKNKRIFGCNTLKTPFYDEVPFRPDVLLADVIKIVHPDLLPEHELKYYTPLR